MVDTRVERQLQSPNHMDEILKELKEKGVEVYKLSVEAQTKTGADKYILTDNDDFEEPVVGYIKKPENRVLNLAMTKLPNMVEAGKVIVLNCWVKGGDERILKDPDLLLAASLEAVELIEIRRASLKKV